MITERWFDTTRFIREILQNRNEAQIALYPVLKQN